MRDLGFFSRSSERLSPDRRHRTRGDTLPACSARATSSIRPVRLRGRGPRNVCGHDERGRPIRHRDIGAAADHPRWPRSTGWEALLLAELSSRSGNKLRIRERVTGEAPAAIGSLGEQHPDPLLHRRVARRRSNNACQLGDHRELLLPVEAPGIGEHLHANARVIAVDIGQGLQWELVHERRGVLTKQRDVRHALDGHHRCREVPHELCPVAKGAGRGVYVDQACYWLALSMIRAMSGAREMNTRCPAGSSVTRAFIRFAMKRSSSGLMARSCVATTYHDGTVLQAGATVSGSPSALPAIGFCAVANARA